LGGKKRLHPAKTSGVILETKERSFTEKQKGELFLKVFPARKILHVRKGRT